MRFALEAGTSVEEFTRADKALQEEFAYQQPGLLRRTTARDDDGHWIVVDVWRTRADSDACAERWDTDPIARRFMDLLDKHSIRIEKYETLD